MAFLPTINAKLLPIQSIYAWPPTGAQMLDALYNGLTSATYRNGTARVAGVGSAAKNVVKVQELGITVAVYWESATSTALSVKYIAASRSAIPAPAPVLATGEVFQNDELYIGVVKNAGAYSDWNLSPPFVGGDFFGYCRITMMDTNPNAGVFPLRINFFDLWETQESFLIGGAGIQRGIFANTDAGPYRFAQVGALWDPFPGTWESDGRIYGVATSPGFGIASATAALVGVWPNGTAAASTTLSASRVYAYSPGLGTSMTLVRENTYAFSNSGNGASQSPRYANIERTPTMIPNYMKNTATGNFVGSWRDLSLLGGLGPIPGGSTSSLTGSLGGSLVLPVYDATGNLVASGPASGDFLMLRA